MQTHPISDNSSEKFLQNNDTDMSESLNSKTLKKILNQRSRHDQNQDKNWDKSHKKKGTENIAQVITDGIQNNILSDESEARYNFETLSLQSSTSSSH
ncbi:4736_t:CDS:1, partial [Acaulospora colombiana]